jgi:hypothetical protein
MTRKVIPAETPAAGGAQGGAALNEYEEARAARIARNNEMLAALGVHDAVARVATQGITTWRRTKPQSSSAAGHKRSLTESRTASAPAPEDLAPVRVSKRQRLRKGLPVDDLPEGGARSGAPGDAPPGTPELEGEYSRLLTVDEYLDRKGLPKGAFTLPARCLLVACVPVTCIAHVGATKEVHVPSMRRPSPLPPRQCTNQQPPTAPPHPCDQVR